ncbi:MAG: hypothetical protein ABJG15_18170 [Hyphomonadaceae bacterium]
MSKSSEGLLRALRRGGMLVLDGGRYLVYRSRDARRGSIGILQSEVFDKLCRDAAIQAVEGQCERWVWTLKSNRGLPEQVDGEGAAFAGLTRQVPSRRTLLETVLLGERDLHEREWMARGVARFMRDYEQRSAMQSVTMSWSFERGGHKRGQGNGAQGMSEMSLSAERLIQQVENGLGAEDFKLLELVLVERRSRRRLCVDFSLTGSELTALLADILKRLARLYDRKIPAAA